MNQNLSLKEVVKIKDKKFKANYKLIYLYCFLVKTTNKEAISKDLGVSLPVLYKAFHYFKEQGFRLPSTTP